jgi:hypothetical protein
MNQAAALQVRPASLAHAGVQPPRISAGRTMALGPLVRARAGSPQELLFEHPGGSKGAFAWHFTLQLAVIALVGSVLDLNLPWGPLAGAALAGGLSLLPVQLGRWQRRRRLARQPLTTQIAQVDDGTLVRLSGIIEPERAAFPALGSGVPAVFARTLFVLSDGTMGGPGMREDIRGVPFRLRLADGTRVRLDPASLHSVDVPAPVERVPLDLLKALSGARPRRLRRRTFRQVVLSPGERIEVLGCLVRDVRPDGQATPGRGVPMVFTLMPGSDGRVNVRKRRRF